VAKKEKKSSNTKAKIKKTPKKSRETKLKKPAQIKTSTKIKTSLKKSSEKNSQGNPTPLSPLTLSKNTPEAMVQKKQKSKSQFVVPKLEKTKVEVEAEKLEINSRKTRELPFVNILKKNKDGSVSRLILGTTVPMGGIEIEGAEDELPVIEVDSEEQWADLVKQHDKANIRYERGSEKENNPANLPDIQQDSPPTIVKKKKRRYEKVIDEEGDEDDTEPDDFSGRKPRVYVEGEYNLDVITAVLRDMKAWDVVVIDVSNKSNWVPFMVFATGRSGGHIRGIAQKLLSELKSRRRGSLENRSQK